VKFGKEISYIVVHKPTITDMTVRYFEVLSD
jgi:hypothetical protein